MATMKGQSLRLKSMKKRKAIGKKNNNFDSYSYFVQRKGDRTETWCVYMIESSCSTHHIMSIILYYYGTYYTGGTVVFNIITTIKKKR